MSNIVMTPYAPETTGRLPLIRWVTHHSLAAFFLLTFSYSWLLGLPLLLSSWGILPFHLARLPALLIQLVAAWGPTFSALLLTGLVSGKVGLRALLGRLVRWRVGIPWYLFVFASYGLIILAALGVNALLGGALPEGVQLTPWYTVPLQFILAFPLYLFVGGPLAEEPGWRGFALPRLLENHGALFSTLLIGVIWACWHLPLFAVPGTGSGSGLAGFVWFFLQLSGWGVLLGWVYINTRSLLLCVLFHAAGNTFVSAILPVVAGTRPYMLMDAFIWVVVLLVVVVAGPVHLSLTQRVARQVK